MRCSVCLADLPPGEFSNSQKKRPASSRKCSACVATPASVAGGDALREATPAAAATSAEPPRMQQPSGSNAPAAAAASSDVLGVSTVPPTAARLCAWARCGKELPGDPALRKRCARCKQALYCDRTCQTKHWREGGHREACVEPPCCTICLDGGDEPLPIQGGCGCRGDGGLAHVACRAEVAARKARGWHEGWRECPTCGQEYTGAMRLGLARACVEQCTRTRRPGDRDRLAAEDNLGNALAAAGEFSEAAEVLTRVLAAAKRVEGADHPHTLTTARNLANVHAEQGNLAEAEELQVAGLAASRRVNGKEHPGTLNAAHKLASTYNRQGKHAEAEVLLVGLLATSRRVRGNEHPHTLDAATNLAATYSEQGRHAEAEALQVVLLATSRRVRGSEHPGTLDAATNLAATCSRQGRHAEAEALELEVLEASRRVHGAGHPATLRAARNLAETHGHLGKHAEAAAVRALCSL